MLVGISLVMGSACVFNNYLDRDIDSKMERTKNRAIVSGKVSVRSALIYASTLGILGFLLLYTLTNPLTAYVALFGHFAYVILYGFAKRQSVHGTVVGSISGAVPPVVGYVAMTNTIDTVAILLFFILVAWQMPHFYAIALYRAKDYAAASIPVLPLKSGIQTTKIQILVYILAFIVMSSLLTLLGYTGYLYLIVMLLLGSWWVYQSIRGFGAKDDSKWARKLFRVSLVVLLGFSLMISVDVLLP